MENFRFSGFQIFRFSDFLKEREGDNLGDGNISGIPKMGIPLMKSYPFFQEMVIFQEF